MQMPVRREERPGAAANGEIGAFLGVSAGGAASGCSNRPCGLPRGRRSSRRGVQSAEVRNVSGTFD